MGSESDVRDCGLWPGILRLGAVYPFRRVSGGGGRGSIFLSGQGPAGPGAGRGIAVRQFSPLRRREGPPPLPPNTPPTPYHQKVLRFTVFFAVPIFRLLWPKMGQHGPT